MDLDDETSEAFYSKLLELEKTIRRKQSERKAASEANQGNLREVE